MSRRFISLIDREKQHATKGQPAKIIVKVNSLVDADIISALYLASQAGVQIELIVRGICCLRPGIKHVSEHIRVRSIVGQLLEHSRIFYFHNSGNPEVYLGSADWRPRNFNKRVEISFPIEDERLKRELIDEILAVYLKDNLKARELRPDGSYRRVDRKNSPPVNAQQYFLRKIIEST